MYGEGERSDLSVIRSQPATRIGATVVGRLLRNKQVSKMASHNPFDPDYNSDEDVGLDEDSRSFNDRDQWLKMTKGQTLRASLVYFHPADLNAASQLRADARRRGEVPSSEDLRAAARKALEAKAATLGKSVDALTQADRLDLTEVKFKKMMASYQQGLGFVINRKGKDGPDADAVWSKIADPKKYFSTLLLVYPTDRTGAIDKDRLSTDWNLVPWRFGNRVYEDLWKLNAGLKDNGMGLSSQDIKLECKDAQFQNIAVSFVGPSIWQKHEKFRAAVLAKAIPWYERLVPFREMTTDQLRSKLGLGGSAVSDVTVSAGDFGDIMDSV